MSEENRSTARDLPLARSVNEPQLARPVSGEPEEAGQAEEEQQQAPRAAEQEEAPRPGKSNLNLPGRKESRERRAS